MNPRPFRSPGMPPPREPPVWVEIKPPPEWWELPRLPKPPREKP